MTERGQKSVGWRARIAPGITLLAGLVLIASLARSWAGLDGASAGPWWASLFFILLAVALLALAAAVTIDPRPLQLRQALAGAALVWEVVIAVSVLTVSVPQDRIVVPIAIVLALGVGLFGLAATTVDVAGLDDEVGWFGRLGAVVAFAGAILLAVFALVVAANVAVRVWGAIVRGDPGDWIPWGAVALIVAAPAAAFAIASLDSRRAGGGTFYAQAAANRRDSWLLLLTLIGVLAATAEIIAVSLTIQPMPRLWAAAIAGVVGLIAAALAYRFGANVILDSARAHRTDPIREEKLLDVVSELSAAAAIPPPQTFVIEDGSQNAFATGRDPRHASLVVTRGLLDHMDREELQGVIGHELGHVRNLDIRYAMYVAVFVGLVAIVTDGFLRVIVEGWKQGLFIWDSNDDDDAAATLVTGLLVGLFLLIVAGLLRLAAPLFAALVQAATSREREFLADATSVEFTRNPHGLERALASIAADTDPLEAANRGTQHLWFRNPVKPGSDRRSSWLSTHPSLGARVDRLRALEGLERLGAAAASSAET